MEEYFDIVDENGIPTGEKGLRSEAHAQGLWHRTVHIYLFRKKDNDIEFLTHLRAKNKDSHPNKWDTRFGGHLKSGESIEDAVKGEMQDELGLILDPSDLIKGETNKGGDYPNREFTHAYYYEFNGDISSLVFNDGEVQAIKWMKSSDIMESMAKEPDIWTGSQKELAKVFEILKSNLT